MLKYLVNGRIFAILDQVAFANIDDFEQTVLAFLANAYGLNSHSTIHNVSSIHIYIPLLKKLQKLIEINRQNFLFLANLILCCSFCNEIRKRFVLVFSDWRVKGSNIIIIIFLRSIFEHILGALKDELIDWCLSFGTMNHLVCFVYKLTMLKLTLEGHYLILQVLLPLLIFYTFVQFPLFSLLLLLIKFGYLLLIENSLHIHFYFEKLEPQKCSEACFFNFFNGFPAINTDTRLHVSCLSKSHLFPFFFVLKGLNHVYDIL